MTWVGDDDGALRLLDGADEVVQLDGALVTPAFVDAHVHLAATGLNARGVDLGPARSRAEALDLLAAHARASGDRVLFGYGWDDSEWPDGRFTGEQVDRAIGDRIGYVCRVDAHSAVVSGALLRHAPHVAGQEGWDASGWATRRAHEVVRLAVDEMISPAQRVEALRTAVRAAAVRGLASVHELGAPHLSRIEDFAALDGLGREEPIVHVARYWGERDAFGLVAPYRLLGLAGDLCCDGAIGSHTAALDAAYTDDPGNAGHLYLDADEVRDHVLACTRHGVQAGFHVIGDRAIDAVLEGFTAAARTVGTEVLRAARHRLEHAELLSAAAVRTLARLGLHASVQPAFDRAWGGGGGLYETRLGPARAARMNPYAELARAGVPIALGSDTPVTPFDPWGAVRAACDHRTAGQALDPSAAFRAHTVGGWRAAGVDGHGRLAPGAPATYAIWRAADGYDDPVVELLARAAADPPACLRTVRDGVDLHTVPNAD